MTRLEGRPLSAAIAKIGLPIEERTIAGKKVYIWGSLEMPTKAPKEKKCQIRATMNGDLILLRHKISAWLAGICGRSKDIAVGRGRARRSADDAWWQLSWGRGAAA
jgi:hypothetical protein